MNGWLGGSRYWVLSSRYVVTLSLSKGGSGYVVTLSEALKDALTLTFRASRRECHPERSRRECHPERSRRKVLGSIESCHPEGLEGCHPELVEGKEYYSLGGFVP